MQHREEKNYLKLMSKKIQAARSTVPKTRGKKSLLSDQAGAVYRAGLAVQIAAVCMCASA